MYLVYCLLFIIYLASGAQNAEVATGTHKEVVTPADSAAIPVHSSQFSWEAGQHSFKIYTIILQTNYFLLLSPVLQLDGLYDLHIMHKLDNQKNWSLLGAFP